MADDNRLVANGLRFGDRGPYNFVLEPATCTGLQGESGAGKTLLLRALADLIPRQGTMQLGIVSADSISGPGWRRLVAMLPASSSWWLDRVADHFRAFARLEEDLLAAVGFDPSVGDWEVHRLSTGEKQRLAVLRMLENNPRCLLLDEPTASLDRVNVTRVEDLLLRRCRTEAVPLLWVSHDPEQLRRVADRCMVMGKDGRLAERPPEDVLSVGVDPRPEPGNGVRPHEPLSSRRH